MLLPQGRRVQLSNAGVTRSSVACSVGLGGSTSRCAIDIAATKHRVGIYREQIASTTTHTSPLRITLFLISPHCLLHVFGPVLIIYTYAFAVHRARQRPPLKFYRIASHKSLIRLL